MRLPILPAGHDRSAFFPEIHLPLPAVVFMLFTNTDCLSLLLNGPTLAMTKCLSCCIPLCLQAVVLMLFSDADRLTLSEIRAASSLEDKELRRTLQSLACGKEQWVDE